MSNYTEFIRNAADRTERHADPIDQAADRSQQEVDHRVSEARTRVVEQERAAADAATGKCLFCHEPVAAARRWCDAICRDGSEAETKAQQWRR